MLLSTAAAGERSWTSLRDSKASRIADLGSLANGKLIERRDIVEALQTLIHSGDRVALERRGRRGTGRNPARLEPRQRHQRPSGRERACGVA